VIEHILRYTIPAALALLPPKMRSLEATAMLLAIGLQESRFAVRRQQGGGPARGFWQFEIGGTEGVLEHEQSNGYIASVLMNLRYDHTAAAGIIHQTLEHNDTLAAAFARCLLWTAPTSIPGSDEPMRAWSMYTRLWRPGKPRLETWAAHYAEAWDRTLRRDPPADIRKA
jgi:hypothetical protein